jgi:lipopolysaccharide/colanic/teichoic acid biosynthesis glycosyltransferase
MNRTVIAKRMVDVVAASAGLCLTAPVLVAVSLLVRRRLGSPVLFRQQRPGLRGKPFEMVKFRTMRDAVDLDGTPLPDHERITAFGSWLRSTSLDELPELWNVLRGDMSLVGPRPLLMQYLPLYSKEQARRHEVRPGITGWAQVSGRNSVDWPSRFAMDVWYVDHVSLMLDVKILVRTISAVLLRQGISAAGEATMKPFAGTGLVFLPPSAATERTSERISEKMGVTDV